MNIYDDERILSGMEPEADARLMQDIQDAYTEQMAHLMVVMFAAVDLVIERDSLHRRDRLHLGRRLHSAAKAVMIDEPHRTQPTTAIAEAMKIAADYLD